jgi:hypothetical protein
MPGSTPTSVSTPMAGYSRASRLLGHTPMLGYTAILGFTLHVGGYTFGLRWLEESSGALHRAIRGLAASKCCVCVHVDSFQFLLDRACPHASAKLDPNLCKIWLKGFKIGISRMCTFPVATRRDVGLGRRPPVFATSCRRCVPSPAFRDVS